MVLDAWATENYMKKLAEKQTQIKELVPDSLKENGERRMKEYIITDDFLDDLTMKFASAQGHLKELIRCKDCKYWLPHSQFGNDEYYGEYYDYCGRLVPDDDYYAFTRNADDFCSRAKRKEE